MPGPVIMVNGAWHGAWCWGLVVEELASLGVRSVPVEPEGFGGLRGASPDARWSRPWSAEQYGTTGSRAAAVTLDSATAALTERLRHIVRDEPCTLVAHSLGGVVVTAAAELVPELVAEVVYVAAVAPVAGAAASGYHDVPEMAGSLLPENIVADPATTGTLRIDPLSEPGRQLVRRSFYGDVGEQRAWAAVSMLASDAPAAVGLVAPEVSRERFGRLPHRYVVCLRDLVMPPAMQHRFVTELDGMSTEPTVVQELEASHSPFLSVPDRLARILAGTGG